MARTLYLASNNRHKQAEFAHLLDASKLGTQAFEVQIARDLAPDIDWQETGDSFAANAKIKAETVRRLTKAAVLADDSGLMVEALGGQPGVHSSSYGGKEGDAAANNARLLLELKQLAGRDNQRLFPAKFVCVLHFIDEAGVAHVFRGECPGAICLAPRGLAGFGYDPLFLVADAEGQLLDRTMAELSTEEKNLLSHRGRATAQWLQWLRSNG